MNDKTTKTVMAGIMTCLVLLATFIIKVPVPFTQGYVHLGDAAIFLAVLILGRGYGTFAAGVGSALADLLGGYSYYAPWTFVVKSLMAFVVGTALEHMEKKYRGEKKESGERLPWLSRNNKLPLIEIIAMTFGGIEMTVGYYISASLMHGNWFTPLLSVPGNIAQFVVGIILAMILAAALYKTPVKKYFAIK